MASSAAIKLKVGFTTLLAFVILFGGILWVKSYNPAKKKLRYTVEFNDGVGISSGDPVFISGIKIGEVTGVSLSENKKALVRFYFEYLKLSPDTKFVINDIGLMGDKALVILPGSGDGELNPDMIHTGRKGTDLSSLMANANEILRKLDSISGKIDNDLDIAQLTSDFEKTFEKFQNAAALFEELARENKKPLNDTIKELHASAAGVNDFIEKHDNKLEQTLASFQKTSEKISLFVDDMQNLSSVIDTISTYMGSPEGTIGRLIKYDDLYEELRQTNAHIDSFITDFQRNPGKYTKDMKFKLRLF